MQDGGRTNWKTSFLAITELGSGLYDFREISHEECKKNPRVMKFERENF